MESTENTSVPEEYQEPKKAIYAIWFPLLFLTLMYVSKLFEWSEGWSFVKWGVFPRDLNSLKGIILSPFVHSDWNHLFNNSYPIIILGWGLFHFYRPLAYRVFFWIWFLSGLWLWLAARPAFHIGASGIIYGLASFIFFSGLIRKYYRLVALSMLVVFLYGSMFWGLFPIDYKISWEAHLYGAIAGLLLAFVFRKEGPQRKPYTWELEEEEEEETDVRIE